MTCRCSSKEEHAARAVAQEQYSHQASEQASRRKMSDLEKQIAAMSPDPTKYEIVDAVPVGTALVLKVRYPSCSKCAYEGTKILVYRNTSALDALKWKQLDPHFREGKSAPNAAPGPDARFPASERGWKDALAWASACAPK